MLKWAMKQEQAQFLCVLSGQKKASEHTERPSHRLLGISTYLEDVPPFEAQLVVCGGFEVIFGDGFHSERGSELSSLEQGGKGVFPAEETQRSGLSLASLRGLAPERRDTQCHPESEERRL